jgi:hypothetical protein
MAGHDTPHLLSDACVCMCGECVVYTMATARKRDSNWCICPDCRCRFHDRDELA